MTHIPIWLLSLIFLVSCEATTHIYSVENKSQKVKSVEANTLSELNTVIEPYRAQLNKKMKDTLAYTQKPLTKKKIESQLGNWVADGMLWYTNEILHDSADIAICNYGGLRTKSIATGPVLLRHMYELMPFENELMLLTLDSSVLRTVLEHIAQKDGWPVSKGFFMRMSQENKLLDWNIHGNRKAAYKVVFSDFVATGGDGMHVLTTVPNKKLNILVRDALIQYAKHQKNLNATLEGRIIKEHINADQ